MQPLSVLIAQADASFADYLASKLKTCFQKVLVARNASEMRCQLSEQEIYAAVVDLELIDFRQLSEICRMHGDVMVVATHRLADEQMWAAALAAGAIDCCQTKDVVAILRGTSAAFRFSSVVHSKAA